VQLAVGAMAVGLAALAGTLGEGAAKQPLAGGQLGNAGTEAAFGSREFGAVEGLGHILYIYIIQDNNKKQQQNSQCEFAIRSIKGKNTYKIRCFG
jgi:Na+/glutamate symporter